MKLYLDENMSSRVAQALRDRGHDAVSSHEVGNDGLSDEEQFQYATEQGRHLVTYNRRDYLVLADRWYRWGQHFTKILLLWEGHYPRSKIGAQVRALEEFLAQRADDPNLMDYVEYV
jgi:predicted nuclease of predicted toxin-antitoxin system